MLIPTALWDNLGQVKASDGVTKKNTECPISSDVLVGGRKGIRPVKYASIVSD